MDEIYESKTEDLRKLQLRQNSLRSQKSKYIKDNMHAAGLGVEELKIYEDRKKEYDIMILGIKHQLDSLEEQERDQILELEMVVKMLKDAKNIYKKCDFVRKQKICSLFISNIEISEKKKIKITPKEGLELLF